VKRDGKEHTLEFSRGAPVGQLKKGGNVRGTGTSVFFHPDPTIFPRTDFNVDTIRERLDVASFLHRGLKIHFLDERDGKKETFFHENGIFDYVSRFREKRRSKVLYEATFLLEKDGETGIQVTLIWTESTDEHVKSYANGIPTGSGGTHENGMRTGMVKA